MSTIWTFEHIEKIGEHIPLGYSMSTIWAFDQLENRHALYCGEDCMKKLNL